MGLFQQPPPDRFLTLLIRSGHPDRGRGRPQWGSARSCLKPSPRTVCRVPRTGANSPSHRGGFSSGLGQSGAPPVQGWIDPPDQSSRRTGPQGRGDGVEGRLDRRRCRGGTGHERPPVRDLADRCIGRSCYPGDGWCRLAWLEGALRKLKHHHRDATALRAVDEPGRENLNLSSSKLPRHFRVRHL